MTAEIVGILKRDIPKTFQWVTILAAVGGLVWKATPVALAVLATPARVDAIEVQGARVERYIVADSAWKARSLCLQEVQLKIRPAIDLTTRCAQ